jgi:hypothetical protein
MGSLDLPYLECGHHGRREGLPRGFRYFKGKQINIQILLDTYLMLITNCSALSDCSRCGFEKPDSATRTRNVTTIQP